MIYNEKKIDNQSFQQQHSTFYLRRWIYLRSPEKEREKERKCEPRILYPVKLTFKYKKNRVLSPCQTQNMVHTSTSLRAYYSIKLPTTKMTSENWWWTFNRQLCVEWRFMKAECAGGGDAKVCNGSMFWECRHGTTISEMEGGWEKQMQNTF